MIIEKREIRNLLAGLIIIQCVFYCFFTNIPLIAEEHGVPQTSATTSHIREWLTDNSFDSQGSWYSSEIDTSNDVEAMIGGGIANLTVIGDQGNLSLEVDPSNTTEMDKWVRFKKDPDQIYPQNDDKRSDGFYANHYWDEDIAQDENNPAVYWKRIVTMPVDMTDYEITSAFIEANFSALVQGDNFNTGGIEAPGDYTDGPGSEPQNASLDSATFTLDIGDLNSNHVAKPIAQYKTKYLGDDDDGYWSWINETQMINYGEEQDLISDLTSVLAYDHLNFTIILGIEMFCADNDYSTDEDNWYELLITSLNFTFTYKKIIDKSSSVNWNQDGDKLSDHTPVNSTLEIKDVNLKFKYKLDGNWTDDSTHSELLVRINGNDYEGNTIELIDYVHNGSFINVEWDLTSSGLVNTFADDVNFSIVLFLDDTFTLGDNITISIDDIELSISYNLIFDDYQTNLQLFLNGIDKTSDPVYEIPIGENVTIVVKYTNQTGGNYISGAFLQLTGDGIEENLTESATLEHYSIEINVTERLRMGVNLLTITAIKGNHETEVINPRITVRKIATQIKSESGSDIINVQPGSNALLKVILNDTDHNASIIGAIVTFLGDLGGGVLSDSNNDGIYEGIISSVPVGSHIITITAYYSDNYYFETYEITIIAISQPGIDLFWLVILLFAGIVGLVSVFTAYQLYYKYPPMVRKIRSLRRKVKRGKRANPVLVRNRSVIENRMLRDQMQVLRIQPEVEKGIVGEASVKELKK